MRLFGRSPPPAEPADDPFAYDPFAYLDAQEASAQAPRRRSRTRWRIAAALLALFLLLVAWLAVTAPLSRSLQPIAAPGITLLSAEGDPIARSGAVTEQPVAVGDLPPHVSQAFLAIEDRRFYNHSGLDPWGIARAAASNAWRGRMAAGGSTITQQLAKLAFLSSDRTAARKAQEVLMAFWLEAWLSKDEILSRYMSSAYFGDNVYGLRAASKHYFSREPEKLTVGQAAMLAGLVKAPSRLAPTANLSGARTRGRLVLQAMADAGYLGEAEARAVPRVSLRRGPARALPAGTYFADWAFPQARAFAAGGYGEQRIATTLESDLQRHAVRAVQRAGLGGAQVALVAMRPDGRVVAMVGGKSYKTSAFNRATQAKRQPGSTFKLFVYLAALRDGMSPESTVEDAPVTIGDWSPRNSGGAYRGEISLQRAFAQSSNVAAVRLSERVGRENVIRAARDLGVTAPLASHPSIALGTSGVTLLEMTAAYAAVASGRYPVKPRALPEAEDGGWLASLVGGPRRLGGRIERALKQMLAAVVDGGTGRQAALAIDTFGKTGTSQDHRDAIFIGFAGDLVVGVWVGNDDNRPLGGTQGGGLPARIWRDFMSAAIPGAARPIPKAVATPPEEVIESNLTLGDVDIGIDIDGDGLTVTAGPEGTAPDQRPTLTIPLPPPDAGERRP